MDLEQLPEPIRRLAVDKMSENAQFIIAMIVRWPKGYWKDLERLGKKSATLAQMAQVDGADNAGAAVDMVGIVAEMAERLEPYRQMIEEGAKESAESTAKSS